MIVTGRVIIKIGEWYFHLLMKATKTLKELVNKCS